MHKFEANFQSNPKDYKENEFLEEKEEDKPNSNEDIGE